MGVCFRVAAVAAVAEPYKTRPFVWLGLWRAPQQLIVKLAGAAGKSAIRGRLAGSQAGD